MPTNLPYQQRRKIPGINHRCISFQNEWAHIVRPLRVAADRHCSLGGRQTWEYVAHGRSSICRKSIGPSGKPGYETDRRMARCEEVMRRKDDRGTGLLLGVSSGPKRVLIFGRQCDTRLPRLQWLPFPLCPCACRLTCGYFHSRLDSALALPLTGSHGLRYLYVHYTCTLRRLTVVETATHAEEHPATRVGDAEEGAIVPFSANHMDVSSSDLNHSHLQAQTRVPIRRPSTNT